MENSLFESQKALIENEMRYKQLVESVTDYIYTVIVENDCAVSTIHGPGCIAVTGYTTEEYKADLFLWYQMVYAEDREAVVEQASRVIAGKTVPSLEHRIIHKNGSIRWVRNTPVPRYNQEGLLIAYDGLIEDVTERKLVEEALRASEDRYKSVVENIGLGIAVISPAMEIISMNNQMKEWFPDVNVSMKPVCYKSFNSPSREEMCSYCPTCKTLKDGNVYESITEAPLGSTDRNYRVVSSSIKNSEGKIIAAIKMVDDITEHLKMEKEIINSKKDWEDMFDTITDMITVHDKDFNIVRANKSAQKILNLPFIMNGTKCYTYYHGKNSPPEGCPSCKCLASGKPAAVEICEPHLNMNLEIKAIPRFDGNNEIIGLIHIVRDITERKKLENQLRHAQKMESVGTLAGGVAHDFNNIMTAIISFGNLLKKKINADGPLKFYVEQILEASESAANLTQSLLAFSRKQIINPRPVDINEILAKIRKLLMSIISEDIEVKITLSEAALNIMADPVQIEQVLINLTSNAKDAMPNGGKLSIKTGLIELDNEYIMMHGYGEIGSYVCISIIDTGIGMDAQTRDRIFEPFFTTKEVGKGTGLGLSMVYGIIKQHNGYIDVYSEPGEGASFNIYIPLIKLGKTEKKPAKNFKTLSGSETILLAEDDARVRKSIKIMLEEMGYKVIEAENGEDLVVNFMERKENIHLVILDVIMPRKNGREAYKEIKAVKPDCKIIFISGYTADIIHKKGIFDNNLIFLSKPISPDELLTQVRTLLDN